MKKILKYSLLAVLALAAVTGCKKEELDTDQFSGFSLAAIAPNPVMRGGELRLVGNGLENVTEVQFAGGVTVSDITVVEKGSRSEIRVMVPLEGPEVGKVTVVTKEGLKASTKFDLTFTQPIEVASFSPATVFSGDQLTIKGEYLNDVKEVIFSGENAVVTEFVSQSRHELKVMVPFNAISGPVIVSDVNELVDENTIPNHIYTKTDLEVGDPYVQPAKKATYKSGDLITVKGSHLDMIKNVAVPQVNEVEFTVAEDAASLSFNLPPKASDGVIVLTSYAGKDFTVGEIKTVSVTDLSVKPLAADGRFKAGYEVEISGSDLDLVTKVEFTGAEADWYMSKGKIIAGQPVAAKDGIITVTLESGKQAYSEEIEVVKPVITSWDAPETLVAGQSEVVLFGDDLDLVDAVVMGDKKNGFIECAYEWDADDAGNTAIAVQIPVSAYTGPILLTSAAGYETTTDPFEVTYDLAVSIKFSAPSFGLGQNITITGSNLLRVEQVYIKGKKVLDYALRADDAMTFAMPDGIGPGVYRLALVLTDGTELTWPVAFEITAPFTETFYWEGSEDLGNWGPQPYLGEDGALAGNVVVGDVIRIYYTPYADWWQFEIFDGHWGSMSFPELDGGNAVKASNTDPDATYFAFEVTEDNIGAITSSQGWGGIFVVQGESVIITGVSVIHFGAAEKRTVIWEGSSSVTWSGGAVTDLSWGGYDWSTVEAGTKLSVAYTIDDPDGCIRFGNGSWAALPSLAGLAPDGNLPLEGTGYTFELTSADLNALVNEGGLVVCGTGYTITEIALVTMEGAGPVEQAIWEGSSSVTWSGGAVTDLSWGGYDWSTVEAGTILCAHYTIDDPEGCIRFGNGSWAALPSLAGLAPDGNLPLQEGGHEVELTQADIDEMVANGGLVVCGTGYTITQIGLK